MADHLYSFDLGDMRMSVIGEGTLAIPAAQIYRGRPEGDWRPLVELDRDGRVVYGMNVLVCRSDDGIVLVDTGVGESHPTRDAFERKWAYTSITSVLTALADLGIGPEEVTHVVISHAHGDHFMGCTVQRGGGRVPTFANARYVMMKQDWHPAGQDPDSAYSLHLNVLEKAGCLDLLECTMELIPGLTMIPAPGESPGHALVRFESRDQVAYFLGDLFHDPTEVAHPDWVWPGRDHPSMLAHMPFPGVGRIVRHGEGLRWEPVTAL